MTEGMAANASVASLIASPIGVWLNFSAEPGDDGISFRLGFAERHIGNPLIRALHGGCIAAFLELSMQAELAAALNGAARPATANISIDYLASSRAEDMHARARILRLGKRIAFAEASGWQHDAGRPVAVARAVFRLS